MTDELSRTPWRPDNDRGLWTLWFDAPGRSQNVLDRAAFDGLDEQLARIEADPQARGVVVRSAKPGGFCAGADLKAFQKAASPAELAPYVKRGVEVMDRLARLKAPTVAVVHGACLGGGLELALACRSRVALASNVSLQIGSPEVQLGLLPCWGALVRLPRLINPRDAFNLLLTGNPLGFLQAKSLGIVDRLVAQDEPGRIAEALEREPAPEKPLDAEAWEAELEFAARKTADQSADFPEAQQDILDLIRIDITLGPDEAKDAAIEKFLRRVFDPATRQAIDDFFSRRSAPPPPAQDDITPPD